MHTVNISSSSSSSSSAAAAAALMFVTKTTVTYGIWHVLHLYCSAYVASSFQFPTFMG